MFVSNKNNVWCNMFNTDNITIRFIQRNDISRKIISIDRKIWFIKIYLNILGIVHHKMTIIWQWKHFNCRYYIVKICIDIFAKKAFAFSRYYGQFKFHIQFYFTGSVSMGMFTRKDTVIRDFYNGPTFTWFCILGIYLFYDEVVISVAFSYNLKWVVLIYDIWILQN